MFLMWIKNGKFLKEALQEASAEAIGFSTSKHWDWFDESDAKIDILLARKGHSHKHVLARPDDCSAKIAYRKACNTFKAKLRALENDWWSALAERLQGLADAGDTGSFHEAFRAVYGPHHQAQASLSSADGSTLLTDKDSILSRWFECLFCDKRSIQESSLAQILQVDVNLDLDVPPNRTEIRKAIAKMKPGKAPPT